MKTIKILVLLSSLLIMGNANLFAQDVSGASKVAALAKEANQKYASKDYKRSADLNIQAFNLTGQNGVKKEYLFAYNAVCCLSLIKDVDKAYNVLFQVVDKPGFKELYGNLKTDSDLKLLRSDERWKKVEQVINN